MGELIRISGLRVTRASAHNRRSGLRAYLSFVIDDRLRVDGVTLRSTKAGQPVLSFPARKDRRGIERPYIWPIDGDARREVEQAVFDALGVRNGGGL